MFKPLYYFEHKHYYPLHTRMVKISPNFPIHGRLVRGLQFIFLKKYIIVFDISNLQREILFSSTLFAILNSSTNDYPISQKLGKNFRIFRYTDGRYGFRISFFQRSLSFPSKYWILSVNIIFFNPLYYFEHKHYCSLHMRVVKKSPNYPIYGRLVKSSQFFFYQSISFYPT